LFGVAAAGHAMHDRGGGGGDSGARARAGDEALGESVVFEEASGASLRIEGAEAGGIERAIEGTADMEGVAGALVRDEGARWRRPRS
jgi:hypothetical protein